MPKVIINVALRGEIPEDAEPIGDVARRAGISRTYLQSLLGTRIPAWLYLGRYYYCRLTDVIVELQGRRFGTERDNSDSNNS